MWEPRRLTALWASTAGYRDLRGTTSQKTVATLQLCLSFHHQVPPVEGTRQDVNVSCMMGSQTLHSIYSYLKQNGYAAILHTGALQCAERCKLPEFWGQLSYGWVPPLPTNIRSRHLGLFSLVTLCIQVRRTKKF
jgi:hypothetical protein